MSNPRSQLSIYIRNCLHHNRGGRPSEIELRIVSTDISSAACEDRTKVILSTRESSSSSCRESRTTVVDAPDTASSSSRTRKCSCPSRPQTANRCAPFRRRVSFSDAAVIGTDDDRSHRTTIMQDDELTGACRDNDPGESEDNGERETFYDIWQADDSSAGKSDDGYSESTSRFDNYAENHCVSSCISNNSSSKGQRSKSIDVRTVEADGRARGGWPSNKNDACPVNRLAETRTRRVDEDDTVSKEDLSNPIHKDVDSIGCSDEYRMRGGCGGCYCGAPRENIRRRSSQEHGCCFRGLALEPNESFAAPCTDAKMNMACTVRCCCRCPRVCKKAVRCCETSSSCRTGVRSCGSGCRSGCGKPSQICTPSPRNCNASAHSSRGKSPCVSRPRCPPQPACPTSGCRGCCNRSYECGRSRSPECRSTLSSGCCINDGAKCGADVACCRLKLPCECLGGGLDCRRCGRKVYQAEMQIVSGVPYHSICFSCFCCRKPLEPLTYQENCGEIYCKQCYVRNFGPQGYGYGAGAGVLQTPL